MPEELVTKLIDILKDWAKKQNNKYFREFYLFGSLIYKGGNQFLRDISDIDLIVVLQNSIKGSLNRAKVCQKLQKAKLELELLLRPIVQRKKQSKSIVSLVLATDSEVAWDIHKTKSLIFFRCNSFLNLLEENNILYPIGYSTGINDREKLSNIIQAIEKAQDYRNKYLFTIPDKLLEEYNKQDVFPKDLARSAALVCAFDGRIEKEKFDINSGINYLIFLLQQKVGKKDNEWSKLNSKVGERVNRSIKRPNFSDFDLLLLHELLFDKAYKLLGQKSPIKRKKDGHPVKAKRKLSTSTTTKEQSKNTPESKTKSESPIVVCEPEKTTLADSVKPDIAKKKTTTSRKAPVSKTSTTRSYGTKDPKDWVMLNEQFFRTKKIQNPQDRIILQLLPMADMEQIAELKSLQPGKFHHRKQITYADRSEVGIMQVSSVESELSAGKTSFNITLTPTYNSQNSGFAMGMSYNNYSANDMTRLARLMLLGEPLSKDLEYFFPTTQVEKGIFPELWVKLQTQQRLFLPKAWLKAVYCLKMNGIVDDVLELELGPIKDKVMPVQFRGRRRQAYANPSIIEVVGNCTLGK